MAAIPRIGFDSLPASGVPRGAPPASQTAAKVAAELSSLGETGAQLLGQDEKFHALQFRRAAEAKQAVANESSAAVASSDHSRDLGDKFDALKAQYADSPTEVPDILIGYGRQSAQNVVEAAPNDEDALMRSRKTSANVDAIAAKADAWVSARQTQIIKVNADKLVNSAIAEAEEQPSSAALGNFLDGKEKELAPMLLDAHGEAAHEMVKKLRTQGTEAWLKKLMIDDPIATRNLLDDPQGPFKENLDGAQREAMKQAAVQTIEGFGKVRSVETVRKNILQNLEVGDAFIANPTDPSLPGAIYARQRENESAQKAAAIDSRLTPEQRKEQVAHLERQANFLRSLEEVRRLQTPLDTTEDVEAAASLLQRRENLFKKNKGDAGKDLVEADKFLSDLVVAARGRKISGGTFATLFKDVSLDLPKALSTEQDNTWSFNRFFLGWGTSPRQGGNGELNRLFDAAKKTTPEMRVEASKNFIRQYVDGSKDGRVVTDAQAKKMAQRAFYQETHTQTPPGFDK